MQDRSSSRQRSLAAVLDGRQEFVQIERLFKQGHVVLLQRVREGRVATDHQSGNGVEPPAWRANDYVLVRAVMLGTVRASSSMPTRECAWCDSWVSAALCDALRALTS